MKILSTIVEILTSPFTLLFRTKAAKSTKTVNIFVVLSVSLLITAALLLIFYYTRLF